MNRLMQEYGLSVPEYDEISGSFVVAFGRKEMKAKETVQVSEQVTAQVEAQVKAQVEAQVELTKMHQRILLECLNKPISKKEIAKKLGHRAISGSLKKAIVFLLEKELINYTISDKPQSSKQKYVITEKGRQLLKEMLLK